MLRFAFWNVGRADRNQLLQDLCVTRDLDVLAVIEPGTTSFATLASLNAVMPGSYFDCPTESPRIHIFTRFSDAYAPAVSEGARYSIRRVSLPARPEFLFAVVHLRSKTRSRDASQAFDAVDFADEILSAELDQNLNSTLVVGDLNANPFEDGVVAGRGLHAVSSRSVALRGARRINKKVRRFFYNPMWNVLGDSAGVPGTYYYANNEHRVYFWNTFDQVLMRPSLINDFDLSTLSVLTDIAGVSLLKRTGTPNRSTASDHLPVSFSLNI